MALSLSPTYRQGSCSSPPVEVVPAGALSASQGVPNKPDNRENNGSDPQ
jgi:hypothetical protein